MTCSVPPPLSDDQITAALEGQADPAVLQHLSRCAACAARLAGAQRVEEMLMNKLFRWDCPTPQQLGHYHLRLLNEQDAQAVSRHLEQCVHCRTEVETLRGFLKDDLAAERPLRPAPAHTERRGHPGLGELIARLLPQQQPALALRGGRSGPMLAETDDGTTIFLEVQPGPVLTGQIVADDQLRWARAFLELRQSGALKVTAELDDLGAFQCGPLDTGLTDIRITSPRGSSILLLDLEIIA